MQDGSWVLTIAVFVLCRAAVLAVVDPSRDLTWRGNMALGSRSRAVAQQ